VTPRLLRTYAVSGTVQSNDPWRITTGCCEKTERYTPFSEYEVSPSMDRHNYFADLSRDSIYVSEGY